MKPKEVLAWGLYDLANTAFTSPFRTIFWPLLVTSFLGGNEFQLGLTVTLGVLVFSLFIPIIGTISDTMRIRMPFIIIPSLLTIAAIAGIPFVGLHWSLLLGGAAIVFYNTALSIYNTLLPDIARAREMGKVSGIGIGMGFLGTILSLLVAYGVLRYFSTAGKLETAQGVTAVFPVLAAFFLVFSLPLFLSFKDKPAQHKRIRIAQAFQGIVATFMHLRSLRGMIPFMCATFFFSNALAAIDIFFFLFANKEIGIGLAGFMLVFMAQSLGATTGAVGFGKLADVLGPKHVLQFGAVLWGVAIALLLVSKNPVVFWIAALLGSVAFGGVLSSARALFVFLAPRKKMGEFFGYSQILGKLTGLFGPLAAGWLIVAQGYTAALAMVLLLVVIAFLFLNLVPEVRHARA
jgi:UMF1 family MFS transporter